MRKLFFLGSFAFALLSNCGKEPIGPVADIGIYFNELQSSGGDYIEIYNSTTTTVNLTGFKVYDDATAKFTIASGTIAAKGFLVLNCDGSGLNGNASFKLTSLGESVFLEDSKGNIIDQITFPVIANGSSYACFPDGSENWKTTGAPTKNATNGDVPKPFISLVSRLPLVPSNDLTIPVKISATVTDVIGVATVELFQRKDAAAFAPTAMTLTAGVYSANIPATAAPAKIEYYIKATNTSGGITLYPADAPTTTLFYLCNNDDISNIKLTINEFMAFNATCCPDVQNGIDEFDDWIEIYNDGPNPIDIAGMHLSDTTAIVNPFKFTVATGTASTTIPSKGFLLIWADESGLEGNLHANFQLRNIGEEIGLYYKDGRLIDKYTFGPQTADKSWGRSPDGGAWGTGPRTPTPKAPN